MDPSKVLIPILLNLIKFFHVLFIQCVKFWNSKLLSKKVVQLILPEIWILFEIVYTFQSCWSDLLQCSIKVAYNFTAFMIKGSLRLIRSNIMLSTSQLHYVTKLPTSLKWILLNIISFFNSSLKFQTNSCAGQTIGAEERAIVLSRKIYRCAQTFYLNCSLVKLKLLSSSFKAWAFSKNLMLKKV